MGLALTVGPACALVLQFNEGALRLTFGLELSDSLFLWRRLGCRGRYPGDRRNGSDDRRLDREPQGVLTPRRRGRVNGREVPTTRAAVLVCRGRSTPCWPTSQLRPLVTDQ